MDTATRAVVHEQSRASNENRTTFPAVVKSLIEAGVERYYADLVAGSTTFYMPDGGHEVVTTSHRSATTASAFSAAGVEQAIRAIQHGDINYTTFCERIAAAGCVAYIVSLVGKRATYIGRDSEFFVEWFPGARP